MLSYILTLRTPVAAFLSGTFAKVAEGRPRVNSPQAHHTEMREGSRQHSPPQPAPEPCVVSESGRRIRACFFFVCFFTLF